MAAKLRGLPQNHLRALFSSGTTVGLTDGQLLERFAARSDESSELAFAALVERHGPMVLRACRDILRDEHEAMDVFQATFLVLARKGGSLWVSDSVGPWLHRVACRAASRARSRAARQRTNEQRAAELKARRNGSENREELASLVHEEVSRLPERYRAPIVLCDLEGLSCEQAARQLGCPVGTIGSRLSRGRRQLRDRLLRRGLAPQGQGGPLAILTHGFGPSAPIPPGLATSTAWASVQFASIPASPTGAASSLALGVLRSMTMTYWCKAACALFAVGASTTGILSFVATASAVSPPDEPPSKEARQNNLSNFLELSLGIQTPES